MGGCVGGWVSGWVSSAEAQLGVLLLTLQSYKVVKGGVKGKGKGKHGRGIDAGKGGGGCAGALRRD